MATRLPLYLWALAVICSVPVAAQDQPAGAANCVVVVALHWPDHDLGHAQVRVFRDAARRDLVEAFPSMDAEGRVIVAWCNGERQAVLPSQLFNLSQVHRVEVHRMQSRARARHDTPASTARAAVVRQPRQPEVHTPSLPSS